MINDPATLLCCCHTQKKYTTYERRRTRMGSVVTGRVQCTGTGALEKQHKDENLAAVSSFELTIFFSHVSDVFPLCLLNN